MNASRHLAALFAAGLIVAACGGGSGPSPLASSQTPASPTSVATAEPSADPLSGADLDALVAAATAEGTVVVYSFTSRIASVEEAFEAAYPGIDLVGNDLSSTEMIARIKAEADAGIAGADVAYISDAPVVLTELVADGQLTGWVPPQFTDRVPLEFQAPLLANRLSTKVLMYNEETFPNGSPITNLWQLTLPEWNGKVVLVDPLVRGDYLDLMTEVVLRADEMAAAYEAQFAKPVELSNGATNAGEQWIIDLFANDVVLTDDTDNVNAAIGAMGQAAPPIGFTSYSDRRDNEDEGWALQVATGVAPANGIVFPALLGIVKGSEHPAAARLLIHFMLGDDTPTGGEGYAPFYVAGDYATRTDIAPHPDAVPLSDLGSWTIDPARTAEVRKQVADLILTLQ